MPDGATVCTTDVECDDTVFCNGPETCDPEDVSADARGCITGSRPCEGAGECEEAMRRCEAGPCPDADGDGHDEAACGGDDCDDADPNAFPGNPEVCDAAGHDEDCNPDTLGPDADSDGYVDDRCCNRQATGSLLCGLDCDDTSSDVNPEAIDACGGGDQDCDGDIDEEPELTFFRDIDGDGFGIPSDTVMACGAPGGYALLDTDCNDMVRATNPSARELCDVEAGETPDPAIHDQDCDGAVDEGCECPLGATRPCGGVEAVAEIGVCRPGTQTCIDMPAGTMWGTCSSIEPAASDVCDGADNDCDMAVDEPFVCRQNEVSSGTTACGNPGTRRCSAACAWLDSGVFASESTATCDYCDDTGAGIENERTFATAPDKTLVIGSTSPRYGAADEFSGSVILVYGDPETAGSAVTPAQTLGHGSVTFTATMDVSAACPSTGTCRPGQGWSLWMVETGASPPLGTHTNVLGVPRDRDGFSAEWHFNGISNDQVLLRQLRRTSVDPIVASSGTRTINPSLGGSTTQIKQGLAITVVPDVPGTAANETEIRVDTLTPVSGITAVAACGGSAPACPFRLTPGVEYVFGASAATGTNRSNVFTNLSTPPTVVIRDLCPGD